MRPAPAAATSVPGAPRMSATPTWAAETSRGWFPGVLAWVLMVLMVVPDNFDYMKLLGDAPTAGSWGSRILWIGLVAGGFACIVSHAGMARLLVRFLNPFLLLFVVLALCSVIWSIAPDVTIRRCIRVVAMLFVALALMLGGWHPRRFQEVVRPAITAILFGSIIFGLASPELAIHWDKSPELRGAWHGLANHKNSFGALSCIGVILWANAFFAREVGRLWAIVGTAIAVTCLVLSRSTTSMVTATFAVILLAMIQSMPRGLKPYMPYLIVLFVGALTLYSLVSLRLMPGADLLLKPIAHLAGKDVSFTGRTEIWNVIYEHISYHPLLGTGYAAYWVGPIVGSHSYTMLERVMFYPGSAHNGYLDVVNDLGFAGLLVLIGYLIVYVRQCIQLSRFDHGQGALFLALFLQQAVTNLSESHWFSVLSAGFVISTMTTAALARGIIDHRLREYLASNAVRGECAPRYDAPRHSGRTGRVSSRAGVQSAGA
jgi:exopolysaccharide production protein ExoQ